MLLAAILLQASAATFAPPLDTPVRMTSEMVDMIGGSYRLVREVRFAREGSGYRAELRLVRSGGEMPADNRHMFERALSTLAERTLVFHLDGAGAVTAIDDMDMLWERFCASVGAMAAVKPGLAPAARAALAERIATPLRALPPEKRRAMLGSLVGALIAEDRAPAPGPVTLPGRSPFGAKIQLAGTRTVTRLPDGHVRSETHAEADSPGPGGAAGHVTADFAVEIDPATGLVVRSTSTERMRAGEAPDAGETVRTTTLLVEIPAVPKP